MEKDASQSPTLYALALRLGGGLLLFLRVLYTLFLEITVPTWNQSTKVIKIGMSTKFFQTI